MWASDPAQFNYSRVGVQIGTNPHLATTGTEGASLCLSLMRTPGATSSRAGRKTLDSGSYASTGWSASGVHLALSARTV